MLIFSLIDVSSHGNLHANLLQPFSSEASAQSMTWLHQAEAATQLPSLQDDSDGPHVTSGGEAGISISKRLRRESAGNRLTAIAREPLSGIEVQN